jgi:hypothetical protein
MGEFQLSNNLEYGKQYNQQRRRRLAYVHRLDKDLHFDAHSRAQI